jgi:lipopolysaccharide heptosyltransferase II
MKFLVIRFSSIGDVTQSLSIAQHIQSHFPAAEVHFLTKSDYENLMVFSPYIKKIWTVSAKDNFFSLIKLAQNLSKENYTHLYDAHNNLRSNLFYFLVSAQNKLQRPMMRFKRFSLLFFKINLFEMPFSGQRDLLKPLEKWSIPFVLPAAPQLFLDPKDQSFAKKTLEKYNISDFIVLVPSAAHILKRWPIEHWKNLIQLNPTKNMIILAGPDDHFTAQLELGPNVINLTGKTNLAESAALIERATVVVTNDTGMLHFAEQLGRPTIALMGPAPFGFPSRQTTKILERKLKCRPCSKHGQGPCVNSVYQECLASITPQEVQQQLNMLCS